MSQIPRSNRQAAAELLLPAALDAWPMALLARK